MYVGGSKIATMVLHLIPSVGTVTACGVNGFLNALYTHQLGNAVAGLVDRSGLDFDDTTAIVTMILPLILCVPALSDISDTVSMLSGS